MYQCSGSASWSGPVWSVCFRASRIEFIVRLIFVDSRFEKKPIMPHYWRDTYSIMVLPVYRCWLQVWPFDKWERKKWSLLYLILLYFLILYCSCRLLTVGCPELVLNCCIHINLPVFVSCQVLTGWRSSVAVGDCCCCLLVVGCWVSPTV
jgi:hypothetical protein